MTSVLETTKYIALGGKITFELFAITIVLSIPLGIVVSLGKLSKSKILRRLLGIYTWVFRGTPLLLQVFFVYFGLPVFGVRLQPLSSAALAFTLNYTAYLAEIFRAGIQSIDKGQYEAAKVLGMNYRQTMIRIIIPQAIPRVLPPISNETINLIKDTALVSVIGLGEISRAAKEIVTREFTVTPFIIACIIYLGITSIFIMIFRKLENRYAARR